MFWRGPAWPSAARARHLWGAGKTTIWHAKVRFYQGFGYFSESEVGAGPKELTLSVLRDLSRRIERKGAQHAGKRCKAPRRIYVAFGEHPAAGVCVCVRSLKLDSSGLVVRAFVCVHVCGGVCSFVSLFADSRLSLFPWLVGWLVGCMVCVCLCVFRHLRHIFVVC